MRFLISALGSAGDVHPFIAISRVLRSRGHEVVMIAAPRFEQRVRAAGVDFAAMGTDAEYERMLARPELWQARSGARLIFEELLRSLPEAVATTAALAGPAGTVLVGSTLSWGMRIVQEVGRRPGATVHLSPACLLSATRPPVLPGIGDPSWLPAWMLRPLLAFGERAVLDRWLAPRLNAVRAGFGLAPVRRIWTRWMHAPDCVIGAWPEWFAPVQPDWPPHTTTAGFPLFDEGGLKLDPVLERFVATGPRPIGITPGSAMAHGNAFFDRALDACRTLGRRAVLITPYREALPTHLPADLLHVPYAPFSALLPRLAGLVHHGGIGTSAQALAAGIPQIVVPFAHDQFDNAARLRRLGVGTTLAVDASRSAWVDAIGTLDDATDAVARGAARMAAGGSAAEAIASRLEALGAGHGTGAPIDR